MLASGSTSLISEDPLKPLESKAVIWKLLWQLFGDLFHELDGWQEISVVQDSVEGTCRAMSLPRDARGGQRGCKDQSWLMASLDRASSAFSASNDWRVGSHKKL